MFIGIRDILFAKGRFLLISSVIALMSFMVVALSALTNGLQGQSISAVQRLPGDSVVLQAPAGGEQSSLAESSLDGKTVAEVSADAQSPTARLGVTTTRLSHGDATAALSVFGSDDALMPTAEQGAQPGEGEVLLSSDQAGDLGVSVGDSVKAGSQTLTVSGIGDAGSFAHTPVGYTTLGTWNALSHDQGVSAVVVFGSAPDVAGTTAMPMSDITDAVPGYSSEHGSLLAMQFMLMAISALVVGAFFTVWTQQRKHDLAVVRAMGADRSYLLRDGIGQAVVVLVAGQIIGVVVGVGLALVAAASGAVPIMLTASGVLVPVIAMTVLGLIGAFLAVRTVTKVDPLVALNR